MGSEMCIRDRQISRFTAQTGTVIDDFAVDLAGREIDEAQDVPQKADISIRDSSPVTLKRLRRSARLSPDFLTCTLVYITAAITRGITLVTTSDKRLVSFSARLITSEAPDWDSSRPWHKH